MVWTLFWKSGLATVIFWFGNGYMSEVLDRWLPWTDKPLKRLLVSLSLTILYTSLAFVFIFWLWTFDDFGWDFMTMLNSLRARHFIPTLIITFFISLFLHGRTFLLNWKQTLVEAERLKKDQISARYEALKSQVNPHFLFNSLNVLSSLVHRDADLAEKFIRQLSDVYRYILDSRSKESVPISEELQTLRAYLFLMVIRFGGALQTHISIPENSHGFIAPLTLQMLVENAVKHNVISASRPLTIEIFVDADNYVVVRNNIQKKIKPENSTHFGLQSLIHRYRLLGERPVIVEDDSTYFTVKVPVKKVSGE